eukprot:TRINITY_DN14589_c0_g1_i2.p1 TRINITY_DN14589_c0_g1~~TRINITY_DN14589_c0_g1_i2.p1  ORF type:complete len:483 (-),score=-8.82 TRINITY_DN14589_c0_g1_i2:20-1468(-)
MAGRAAPAALFLVGLLLATVANPSLAGPPSTSPASSPPASAVLSLPVAGCRPASCANPVLGFYKGTFLPPSNADDVQNMNYGTYTQGTRISSSIPQSSTTSTSFQDCCTDCARNSACHYFQFYTPDAVSSAPGGQRQCFLLSDAPAALAPSGALSYVGGFCNPPNTTTTTPTTSSSSSVSSSSVSSSSVSSSSVSSSSLTNPTPPNNTVVGVTSPPPPGVKGDPHFVGWDGVHFDFTGQPGHSYCMLSDSNVHVNMFLDGFTDTNAHGVKETHSWIKGIGFVTLNHKLALFARTSPSPARTPEGFMKRIVLDGREFSLQPGTKYATADGEVEIEFDEAGRKEEGSEEESDVYTVTVRDQLKMLLRMKPEIGGVRRPEDSFIHFSMEVLDEHLSTRTHGILGQTLYNLNNPEAAPTGYDVEYSGVVWAWQVVGADAENYIQGSPGDYVTSHLLTTDCRFSRFARRGLFHSALSLGCWKNNFVC